MFLSRISLAPEALANPRVARLLADPYRLHQVVWSFFGDRRERARDFQYRVDGSLRAPRIFTLSERPPLESGEHWCREVRELDPELVAGDRLDFDLLANPIVTRDGKRHDVVMDAKRRLVEAGVPRPDWPSQGELAQDECSGWLCRRAASLGVAIDPAQVRVQRYTVQSFRKPVGDHVRLATCELRGLLTVEDPETFLNAWKQGIGPAKGFGCGLLLIRRARN
jgi:CRISPR system Cascade subunit CasE